MKLSFHRRFGFLNLARVAQTGLHWGWAEGLVKFKRILLFAIVAVGRING